MVQIDNKIAGCAIATLAPENRRMTIVNESQMKQQLNAVIDQHEYLSVIIDMKDIDLIDSTGLGSLISIFNHGRNNNCKVKFCNMSNAVTNVIRMTHLDQILEIYPSLKDATASL